MDCGEAVLDPSHCIISLGSDDTVLCLARRVAGEESGRVLSGGKSDGLRLLVCHVAGTKRVPIICPELDPASPLRGRI